RVAQGLSVTARAYNRHCPGRIAVVGRRGRAHAHGGQAIAGAAVAGLGRGDARRTGDRGLLVVLDRHALGAARRVARSIRHRPGHDGRAFGELGRRVVDGALTRTVVTGGWRAQRHARRVALARVGRHIGEVGRTGDGRLLVILDRHALGAARRVARSVRHRPGHDGRAFRELGRRVVDGALTRTVVTGDWRAQRHARRVALARIGRHIGEVRRTSDGRLLVVLDCHAQGATGRVAGI